MDGEARGEEEAKCPQLYNGDKDQHPKHPEEGEHARNPAKGSLDGVPFQDLEEIWGQLGEDFNDPPTPAEDLFVGGGDDGRDFDQRWARMVLPRPESPGEDNAGLNDGQQLAT